MAVAEEAPQPSEPGSPPPPELADLLADLPWLLKQMLADGVELLETDGRLALRSLLLIAALTLCLAGLIAGSWVVLVALCVYGAVEAGVPGWGIVLGVLVLHALAFAVLAQQMRALARYAFFPNSRRAVADLFGQGARAE
ncbi:hypothetical protein ACXYTJ_13030 [Gilvimarinus sp. F26214L]|uniref:hypothetical protein n=1 Tax=Gilvimarinus sp. DZF01 TaxID=3461371 RepID=UPI004045E45B